MLYQRPDIARHVQKLVIRPQTKWKKSTMQENCVIAAAVRRAAGSLDALKTFVWDGEDMCPYDDMWFGLRMLYVAFICCARISPEFLALLLGVHV
jgi:hypothetical protein